MKNLVRFFSAVACLVVFASSVSALTARGIGIYPTYYDTEIPLSKAWFLYKSLPGETVEDSVTVSNLTEETRTLIVYPVDSTTNNKGGFALEDENDSRDLVGSWVTFFHNDEPAAEVEVTLEPEEHVDIPFTFSVPADAELEPGEYAGAIVTQEKDVDHEEGGLFIKTRVGARIYYTAPGAVIKDIAIAGFTARYDRGSDTYQVTGQIQNKGNVTTAVTANLHHKQLMWGANSSLDQSEVRIPPKSTREVNFSLPNPAYGKHGIALEALYLKTENSEAQIESETLTFWAFPWVVATWIALFLALNLVYVCLHRMRSALHRRKARIYTVKAGDTVPSIAEKFGMSWKRLASLNHLRKPYEVHKGQKVMVIVRKEVKGTKPLERPVRAWATVTVGSVVLAASLGVITWSAFQISHSQHILASVLQSLF